MEEARARRRCAKENRRARKCRVRGSRREVIKNYAALGGLWSVEKNGGREGLPQGVTST